MAHHRNNGGYKVLYLSLGLSAVVVIIGVYLTDGLNAHNVFFKLLWPLVRLMVFITVGLFIGQIIEATGWTKTLAVLARPLFRFGNLGNQCSAAFTAAFFSGVTANAMLLDFFQEGKITRKQLFLSDGYGRSAIFPDHV
jgi:hypothetical protein